MKVRVTTALRTLRRFTGAAPVMSLPGALLALGLLIIAKSGLLIEQVASDLPGGAIAATPAPSREPPSLPALLEPQAGPGPESGSATASGETGAGPREGREFSATELELLGRLAERRAALDEREHELDLRAAMLDTTEARLAEQLEELKALQASIETRIEAHEDAEEAELARLVKIYERMKPKAAAAIFDRLEMGVLLDVVSRMAETKASAVIARMDPARARQLTSELAAREDLARLDR